MAATTPGSGPPTTEPPPWPKSQIQAASHGWEAAGSISIILGINIKAQSSRLLRPIIRTQSDALSTLPPPSGRGERQVPTIYINHTQCGAKLSRALPALRLQPSSDDIISAGAVQNDGKSNPVPGRSQPPSHRGGGRQPAGGQDPTDAGDKSAV